MSPHGTGVLINSSGMPAENMRFYRIDDNNNNDNNVDHDHYA